MRREKCSDTDLDEARSDLGSSISKTLKRDITDQRAGGSR